MRTSIIIFSFFILAAASKAQCHFYDTSQVKIGQMENRMDSLVFPITFKVVEKGSPLGRKKNLSAYGKGIIKFPGTWSHTQTQLIDSIYIRLYRFVQTNYQPW